MVRTSVDSSMINKLPRDNNEHQTHVYPAEESKLPSQVTFLQRHDESDEPDNVQGKADDSVVRGERHELRVSKDHVLNGQ